METLISQSQQSYLIDQPAFPFCKGCGHTTVLRKLNDALVKLQVDPAKTVLVTDIGCIGLADKMFKSLHTVHTTHGRSTAFATGIALADSVLANDDLKIIVLIGDGGAMIGLQHLVHAAMLNVDITVLVCNNFVYGMTGGQGSGLTPECFVTATTPKGNIVPPADLCGILRNSNAPFVARELATDPSLTKTLIDAIGSPGFAVVEILELCTEYAVRSNELHGGKLREIADQNGWQIGRLEDRKDKKRYSERLERNGSGEEVSAKKSEGFMHGHTPLGLRHPVRIVLAGSAGERVQSAASLLCTAVIQRGGFATQKNDNPVTQGTGFSLSEVHLSPQPIGYTGIEQPDVILVTSQDGWREIQLQGWMEKAGSGTQIYVDESLSLPPTPSLSNRIERKPFRSAFGPKASALGGLLWISARRGFLSVEEMLSLAREKYGPVYVTEIERGIAQLNEPPV